MSSIAAMRYLISAALFAVTTLSSACASDQGSLSSKERWDGRIADNRTDFAARLLDAHNAERRRVGAPLLVWDAALASHARTWADDLARRKAFEHAPPSMRRGEGENLFTGTSGAYSLEEMIGGFIAEKKDFRPGIFPNVSRTGNWSDVGHYTQLIWKSTTRVGCALVTRGGQDWLACRYSPAGNVVGSRVP